MIVINCVIVTAKIKCNDNHTIGVYDKAENILKIIQLLIEKTISMIFRNN